MSGAYFPAAKKLLGTITQTAEAIVYSSLHHVTHIGGNKLWKYRPIKSAVSRLYARVACTEPGAVCKQLHQHEYIHIHHSFLSDDSKELPVHPDLTPLRLY